MSSGIRLAYQSPQEQTGEQRDHSIGMAGFTAAFENQAVAGFDT